VEDTQYLDPSNKNGLPLEADGKRDQLLEITGYLFLIYDYEVCDKGYK